MAAIQAQIQALLTGRAVARGGEVIKVVKPQTFNGTSLKVSGFIMVCRLYIRIRMRKVTVEE